MVIKSIERVIGWRTVHLYGNHELLNHLGLADRYIHPREDEFYSKFLRAPTGDGRAVRGAMFSLGGPMWNEITETGLLMVRLGGDASRSFDDRSIPSLDSPATLFVHGGLDINYISRRFGSHLSSSTLESPTNLVNELNTLVKKIFTSDPVDLPPSLQPDTLNLFDSPLWSRDLAELRPEYVCRKLLPSILEKFQVARIVLGHTPQMDLKMKSLCGSRLLLVDAAMSKWIRKENWSLDEDSIPPEVDHDGIPILGNPGFLIMRFSDDIVVGDPVSSISPTSDVDDAVTDHEIPSGELKCGTSSRCSPASLAASAIQLESIEAHYYDIHNQKFIVDDMLIDASAIDPAIGEPEDFFILPKTHVVGHQCHMTVTSRPFNLPNVGTARIMYDAYIQILEHDGLFDPAYRLLGKHKEYHSVPEIMSLGYVNVQDPDRIYAVMNVQGRPLRVYLQMAPFASVIVRQIFDCIIDLSQLGIAFGYSARGINADTPSSYQDLLELFVVEDSTRIIKVVNFSNFQTWDERMHSLTNQLRAVVIDLDLILASRQVAVALRTVLESALSDSGIIDVDLEEVFVPMTPQHGDDQDTLSKFNDPNWKLWSTTISIDEEEDEPISQSWIWWLDGGYIKNRFVSASDAQLGSVMRFVESIANTVEFVDDFGSLDRVFRREQWLTTSEQYEEFPEFPMSVYFLLKLPVNPSESVVSLLSLAAGSISAHEKLAIQGEFMRISLNLREHGVSLTLPNLEFVPITIENLLKKFAYNMSTGRVYLVDFSSIRECEDQALLVTETKHIQEMINTVFAVDISDTGDKENLSNPAPRRSTTPMMEAMANGDNAAAVLERPPTPTHAMMGDRTGPTLLTPKAIRPKGPFIPRF